MAIEAFAFNLAEKVLEKIASNAYQQLCLAWGLEGELRKLEDKLSIVKAVLLDAEEKQAENRQITKWLAQLKDALYDAEDVLDDFEYENQRRQVLQLYGTTTKKVGRFFSSSNPFVFRFKMGHKIKQIRERFNEIASQRAQFDLTVRHENKHVMPMERKMTHSYVKASDIIGRDNDKEKIIELLQQSGHDKKISVIPIVGIGGLGKTALAKLVYNDERVRENFKLNMWVCVSDDFDVKILVEKIIKSAKSGSRSCSVENLSNLEMDQLQGILGEAIGGKKYLLVLDDVWNEEPLKWNDFKELLCIGGNGSKILVTTRSNQVASIVGTVSAHKLSGLSHDQSVALFAKYAFKEDEEKKYPNLLRIGDEIVRKCVGVPLAVKTLATLLFLKTDESYWKLIRDSELWKLEQRENDILPALRLSYEQLPSHLKRCFAYCSLYPKDYELTNSALSRFWMAHGLLEPANENEELEDIGLRYFKELASRSFLQDFEECFGGLVKCKMHDLVHDLALSLTKNELSVITSKTRRISKSVRHLLFPELDSLPEGLPMMLQGLDRARTIILKTIEEKDLLLDLSLSRFKYLRMLDTGDSNLEIPLERIDSFKHLRYLHLHGNSKMKKVPNSICKLYNLQTLKLCEGFEELPADIRCLINLTSLMFTTKQKSLPKNGVGCLKSLKFLCIRGCENLECLFEDMQDLIHLQLLFIWDCDNLISLPQSMKYLTALKTLFISDCKNLDLTMEIDSNDFNRFNLQKLYLKRLPKLVHLPEWLIQGSAIANTLQLLHLEGCYELKELPMCLQNVTSLQELRIEYCDKLSERCERDEGQDWSKIGRIPKIMIDGHNIQSIEDDEDDD